MKSRVEPPCREKSRKRRLRLEYRSRGRAHGRGGRHHHLAAGCESTPRSLILKRFGPSWAFLAFQEANVTTERRHAIIQQLMEVSSLSTVFVSATLAVA